MVEPSVGRLAYEDMKKKSGLDNVARIRKHQDITLPKDRKIESRYRKWRPVKSLPDVTKTPVTESSLQYEGRDNFEGSHSLEQLAHMKGNALEFYDEINSGCYDVHSPHEQTTALYDEEGRVSAYLRRLEQEEKILNKMAANVINRGSSPTDSEKRLFERNYGKLCETLENKKSSDVIGYDEYYIIGNGRKQCCYPCRKKPSRSNSKVEERRKKSSRGRNSSSPRTRNPRNLSQPRMSTSEQKEVIQNGRRRNSSSSSTGKGEKRSEGRKNSVENNQSGSSYERRSEFSDGRINSEFSNDDYSDISRGGNRSDRRSSVENGNVSDDILRGIQENGEYEDTLEDVDSDIQRNGNEGSPGRTYTKRIDVDIGGNDDKNEKIELFKNSDKSPSSVHVTINIEKDKCRSGRTEDEVLQKWREEILRLCRDNTIRSRDKSDSSYYSPPETLSHLNVDDLVEECKKCIRKCPNQGKINLKKYIEKLLRMSNGTVDELEDSGAKTASDAFIKDIMDTAGQIDNLDYNKDQAIGRPCQNVCGQQTRPGEYTDDMPSPLEDRFPKQSNIPPDTEDNFNDTYNRPSRSCSFVQPTDRYNLSYQSETFDERNYSEIIKEYCDPSYDMPLAPTAITHGEVDKMEPSPLKNDYRLPSDSTLNLLENLRDEGVHGDSYEDGDQDVVQRDLNRGEELPKRSQQGHSVRRPTGRECKSFEVPKSEREFQDFSKRRITEGGIPLENKTPRALVKQDTRGNLNVVERRLHMQRSVDVVESEGEDGGSHITEISEVEEVKQSSILEGYDPNYTLPDFDFFVEKGYFDKNWQLNKKETEHDPDVFLKSPSPSIADKKVLGVKDTSAGKVNLLAKKIGLPWVESTLRRTQAASALSSSSNDDSVDEARKRRLKWQSQSGSVDLALRGIDNQNYIPRPSLTHDLDLMSINDESVNEPIEGEYFRESTPKKGFRSKKYKQHFDGELSEIHPDYFTRFPSYPVKNVSRAVPSYATIPEDDFSLPLSTNRRKFRSDLSFEDQELFPEKD